MEESGSWDRASEADSSDAGRRRDNLGRPGRFPDVVTTLAPDDHGKAFVTTLFIFMNGVLKLGSCDGGTSSAA
jgi:hypothetical protein